jgi:hypothetical protein
LKDEGQRKKERDDDKSWMVVLLGCGLANNEEFLQIFCDKNVSAG